MSDINCDCVGMLNIKGKDQIRRVYGTNGLSPTLTAVQGGNQEVKIAEPLTCAMRGRNPTNPSDRSKGVPTQQRLEIGGDISNTVTTVQKDSLVLEPNVSVRKLTPLECFRLMGFDDDSFYRAKYGPDCPTDLAKRVEKRDLMKDEWKRLWRYARRDYVSNSQLYKQAGNSIVVDVLMAIFKEMI